MTVFHTSGGVVDDEDRPKLEAFCKRVQSGAPQILLHLHGGLVDKTAADKIAERLSGTGLTAYNAPNAWEQVYVVWRTGAFETLRKNWRDLAKNDRLYNALLRKLLELLSKEVAGPVPGARGGPLQRGLTLEEIDLRLQSEASAPFADLDTVSAPSPQGRGFPRSDDDIQADLEQELARDEELEQAALDIEASIAAEKHPGVSRGATTGGDPANGSHSLSNLDPSIRAELEADVAAASSRGLISGQILFKVLKHAYAIGANIVRRYRRGHDHGLHATIVEEIARRLYGDLIGSIIWGMMKGDAAEHFDAKGLASTLFRAVSANPQARLVVVAHSAGSIWASDMLLWAAREKVPMALDLIFLAPAVRIQKFAAALAASEACIKQFRMFAMADADERRDSLLGPGTGFIYPCSLLYMVSGLFEEKGNEGLADAPILGMQRFLGPESVWLKDEDEGQALERVQKFLKDQSTRTVYSPTTGADGFNSNAISHGGFDDDEATLKSIGVFFT